MSLKVDRYGAIASLSIVDEDVFITLVLKIGGEKILQKDGSFFPISRQWGLTAGGINIYEQPCAGAHREYAEETGGILLPTNTLPNHYFEKHNSPRPDVDTLEKSIFLNIQNTYPIFPGRIIDPDIEKKEVFNILDLPTGKEIQSDGARLGTSHWKYLYSVLECNEYEHPQIPDILRSVIQQYPTH